MQFRGKFHPHLDSYPRPHINQNQRLAKKRHLLVAFMTQGAWELRFLAHWCGRIARSHAELCEGRCLTTCSMGIPAERTARFNDWLPETTIAAFAPFQTGRSTLLSPA